MATLPVYHVNTTKVLIAFMAWEYMHECTKHLQCTSINDSITSKNMHCCRIWQFLVYVMDAESCMHAFSQIS